MRIAFIVDPLASLKAYKDTSIALMRAAQARGHAVWTIQQDAIHWSPLHGVCAEAVHLEMLADDKDWFSEIDRHVVALRDFRAVLMRKDPPFDLEYVTTTWLLERAEAEGARVFNRPRALRDHSEKLALCEFASFSVPTVVARQASVIHSFIELERDTILKPLDGMGGSGIFRVRHDDPNRNVIVEMLGGNGARTMMAQRYIPEIADGDKRILLVGGEVVPYCLARIPQAGETRGNLAAGGRGVARELSARDRVIASTLAPVLAARGLLLVGLDVIGDWLTEINVTSPTCMVEIAEQTGFDAAEMFLLALERECLSKP
ncbi:glutathione synthase [Accumulibacter sp.]|uniref:glutathione synthase n=1 Tax=Accumulibacter sp. TaxID=2053492 RepID=UPI00287AE3AF|nr:glutathione synthase [Accumulibacter sp.]MDS4055828.1 glutathione synthase [Accumulibacter sp.]HMX69153.1 glutathione synthase [Accumulibacter sp.]HNC27825.1 glutathione synthase [Accumulibacter sp.]HND39973.1 glutathione synthase [Accumulibacter sp.]